MNKIIKRMNEINARKAEIRGLIEDGKDINMDDIEKELRALNDEYKALEERKQLLDDINEGKVQTNPIDQQVDGDNNRGDGNGESRKSGRETAEYRSAWLKNIRGIELGEAEKRTITTAANSGGALIPTTTVNKIIDKVHEYCPILNEIDLYKVPGGVKIPAEGTTNDAAIHAEGAAITGAADTINYVSLASYEITKLVTISKSVEKMSIDAFENWLADKIGRNIADKIGALIFNGTGSNQPEGINSITWSATNSITVAKSAAMTEANVLAVVALLNGGYDAGAKWYMSKNTFYTDFHPLMNTGKNNIITQENGKYRVLGYPVELDERITLHEAILGDVYRGYAGNMPEDINVTSQFVTRENAYDFLGAAMFDGKVQATEAFVKIVKATP